MKSLPLVLLALSLPASGLRAQPVALPNVTLRPAEVLNLWPGLAPGEKANPPPERIVPQRPRPFDQITDVSVPTLAVFHPPAEKRLGTGVLVIPGGGLDRLAIETEGYEVAEWLNARGLTAFLLKYRVPARSGGPRWKAGVQDAQRAMGLIRARAAEWKVDADAIGAMGFSAGAEIGLVLSVYHAEPRHYERVDAADDLSSRPDFHVAIYAGGITDFRAGTLREDLATRLKNAPPTFIVHAFDDAAQSSIILMQALKRANLASELHLFSAGAHGFGVRDTGLPVGRWRELCFDWLGTLGFLDAPGVRTFAREVAAGRRPQLLVLSPGADRAQAYIAQRRVVADTLRRGGAVAGYKAAFATGPAGEPAHGVLFKGGRIDAAAGSSTAVALEPGLLIETEIGFVIATDIATKVRTPRQALSAVEALVPVIELPRYLGPVVDGRPALDPREAIADNIGSHRFIVGPSIVPGKIANLDKLAVSLRREGRVLHETTGADARGGQAQMLMTLINQIVEQGRILHRGDIIITGALGGPKPAAKCSYAADFGALGRIEFRIE
ncbi:MAG: fumarylacetoacetate hydrolase family protein [Opitutaceae bacterium]|nr:fumarylacetoacetate hydrolase family protein [Opitutaceae bacterium]